MTSKNLQDMMAQLQGALNQGAPKPRKKVNADPKLEGPSRGVVPTPGSVPGIDDVSTKEATRSQLADLAKDSERSDQRSLQGAEEDPELADLLESVDTGSADVAGSPAVAALMSEPPDTEEDATQQSRLPSPEKGDETQEEQAELTGADVESLPPSEPPAPARQPKEEGRAAQRKVLEQMANQVLAKVMEKIDEKLAPIRAQLDEIQTSVDTTKADLYERMGKLAAETLGMETFTAFFEDEFAPVLESIEKLEGMKTQASGLDAQAVAEVQGLRSQITSVEQDVAKLRGEFYGKGSPFSNLSAEVDTLKKQLQELNNSTVSAEAWNELINNSIAPLLKMLEQWEELTGPKGERIKGMVHAHKEASVVVTVEILRNTTEHNFHRLQDFVNDYGSNWVKELMGYLVENPEVVQDKVALAKYNVMYDHMAKSPKLQSYKSQVDAEVKKVLDFAKQLSGGS